MANTRHLTRHFYSLDIRQCQKIGNMHVSSLSRSLNRHEELKRKSKVFFITLLLKIMCNLLFYLLQYTREGSRDRSLDFRPMSSSLDPRWDNMSMSSFEVMRNCGNIGYLTMYNRAVPSSARLSDRSFVVWIYPLFLTFPLHRKFRIECHHNTFERTPWSFFVLLYRVCGRKGQGYSSHVATSSSSSFDINKKSRHPANTLLIRSTWMVGLHRSSRERPAYQSIFLTLYIVHAISIRIQSLRTRVLDAQKSSRNQTTRTERQAFRIFRFFSEQGNLSSWLEFITGFGIQPMYSRNKAISSFNLSCRRSKDYWVACHLLSVGHFLCMRVRRNLESNSTGADNVLFISVC